VYRFLLKPRWIAFHLLVIALMVAMVNLAFWQLRRLDEKKAFNALVRSRSAAAVVPLDVLVPVGADASAVPPVEWRTVRAIGRYDATGQVLIRSRSLGGRPGYHVVAPLVLADGRALLVNRGWIPIGTDPKAPPAPPAPPGGEVTVDGRLRASQHKGTFGASDPATGTLSALNRVDVPRLARQLPSPVVPAYVELTGQEPSAGALPTPIPLPALNEGPHLSYAVQWFVFTICAAVGWVLVVRKSARARPAELAA
jgi:surfeit locus 1 family protein